MKGTSWGGVKTLNSLMKCVAVPQLPRNVELSMSKWLGLKRQNWPVCGQASVFVTRTGRTFGYVHAGHTLLKTDSTPPLLFVQPVGVQCKNFCDTFPTTCANYFDLFLMPKCGCIWYHAPFSGWEKCFVVADAGMTPTSLFVWFKWCFYNGFCNCFFVCCMFVMLLSDTSSRTWPENAHMTNATALPSSCCPGLFWTDCKHTVASRGENYGGIDCYIL